MGFCFIHVSYDADYYGEAYILNPQVQNKQ